jgi:hypothetical protein
VFDFLSSATLRAAHDAARLLYDNHQALGLDPQAIKLDTLRGDICVALENRSEPITPAAAIRPRPADAPPRGLRRRPDGPRAEDGPRQSGRPSRRETAHYPWHPSCHRQSPVSTRH